MKIYKGRIKELIEELEQLDKVIPPDKDGVYDTTINMKQIIDKVNNINWALSPGKKWRLTK